MLAVQLPNDSLVDRTKPPKTFNLSPNSEMELASSTLQYEYDQSAEGSRQISFSPNWECFGLPTYGRSFLEELPRCDKRH